MNITDKSRRQNNLSVLAQLQKWQRKAQPQVTAQNALGKANSCLAATDQLVRYTKAGYLPIDNNVTARGIKPLTLRYRTQELALQRRTQRRDGQRST